MLRKKEGVVERGITRLAPTGSWPPQYRSVLFSNVKVKKGARQSARRRDIFPGRHIATWPGGCRGVVDQARKEIVVM